ncbi:MAG: transcriptional regulator [Alphaproteobacteria bacterium]|jgi:HTH-type transcriptional regulator/antitoxin HigA|nr:transcriptional regulator [Alphaproteobacteria bacterium]
MIKKIHNKQEYDAAVNCIHELWNAEINSPQFEYLENLASLIDSYERMKWPSTFPDPISAIKFHMRQKDLNLTDLGDLLGSPLYAFEILNKKQPLTFPVIWKLSKCWGIPTESLIGSYAS